MKKEFSLLKLHETYFKDKVSYPTFRKLFLENKSKFKDVEIVKFPRKTIYKIYDENSFVETFNSLLNIEKF